MPGVLALVGLGLVTMEEADPARLPPENELKQYLNAHIELLAEAEHDGWMEQRAKAGWRYDPRRDDLKKLHDLMVPYPSLSETEKDKDRRAVTEYPGNAEEARFAIVWLSPE